MKKRSVIEFEHCMTIIIFSIVEALPHAKLPFWAANTFTCTLQSVHTKTSWFEYTRHSYSYGSGGGVGWGGGGGGVMGKGGD